MTVTKIKVKTWEGNESADRVKYGLTFHVETNDRDDGPKTVRDAIGITYGDPYVSGNDSDSRAVATTISERQVSSSHFNHWEVDVEYTSVEDQDVQNPLNDPIEEVVSWNAVMRKVYRDGAGNLILNTANDPFTEPRELPDNTPGVTYTVNQLTFPFALAQSIRNGVNSTPWKGFAAETVKVASMQTTRRFHNIIGLYYGVSYSFEVDPTEFSIQYESFGFRELVGGKKRRILDDVGQWTKIPMPLKADGSASTDLTAAIVEVDYFPLFDFNTLFPFL